MGSNHNMYFRNNRWERLLSYTRRERIASPSEAIGRLIDEKTKKKEEK